jgi:hypothetical protein
MGRGAAETPDLSLTEGKKILRDPRSRKLQIANLEEITRRAKLLAENVLSEDPQSPLWEEAHALMSRIMTHEAIYEVEL